MRFNWPKTWLVSATAVPVIALAILVPLPVRAATPELSFSPTLLRFGYVVVGRTQTLLVVATNRGQSKVTISSVTTNHTEVKASHAALPRVLAAGESLAVTVTFTPTAKGRIGGALTLVSNATDRILTVPFEGTGVAREGVTVSPRSVVFGDVVMGATSKLPVVLTNTNPSRVTLSSLQTQGEGFSVSGATFPLTLAAGQKLKLDITFKPQAVGPTGGVLL